MLNFYRKQSSSGASSVTLNSLRYSIYMGKLSSKAAKKGIDLATLPPTSDSCNYHSLRVYHQVQSWLGEEKYHIKYGWQILSRGLEPICSLSSPAPDGILKPEHCSCCKNRKCKCLKLGKNCSDFCSCIDCSNSPKNNPDDQPSSSSAPEPSSDQNTESKSYTSFGSSTDNSD